MRATLEVKETVGLGDKLGVERAGEEGIKDNTHWMANGAIHRDAE